MTRPPSSVVLQRPVETAPFCGNFDANLGSSVGGIVSELLTTRPESR